MTTFSNLSVYTLIILMPLLTHTYDTELECKECDIMNDGIFINLE